MCASMPNTGASDPLRVAVAVIIDARERVLLTQRHAESHQGGLWEFPGGKLEPGETLAAALSRELLEELAIEVRAHVPLLEVEHDYGDKRVLLLVHRVSEFAGEPHPCEGQPMRWVARKDLGRYAFPKANLAILECLESVPDLRV